MQKECIFVISSKCEQATLVGRGVLGRCRAPARLASKLIIKHGGQLQIVSRQRIAISCCC